MAWLCFGVRAHVWTRVPWLWAPGCLCQGVFSAWRVQSILRTDPSLVYETLELPRDTGDPPVRTFQGVWCWGAGMCSPMPGEILIVSLLFLPAVCWISCFVSHKRNFEPCQRWPWVYRSLCWVGCPGWLGLGSETCLSAGTPELRVTPSLVLGHCPCAQPHALVGVKQLTALTAEV